MGWFGNDDDDLVEEIVEEIVEEEILLELLECGNCRGNCSCGYYSRRAQPLRAQSMQQRRLAACGQGCYHGQCSCAGYDPFGNLLEAMVVEEIVEDIFGGGGDFF